MGPDAAGADTIKRKGWESSGFRVNNTRRVALWFCREFLAVTRKRFVV
jgi:hypothetical protein